MSALHNEVEMRTIIEGIKNSDPKITTENIIKRIRASWESQGIQWSEDLERKIRYCVQINPN